MAVQSQTRVETLANYVGGQWMPSSATDFVHVHNPARGDVIARTPLSTRSDVDAAVRAAAKAFPGWSETPPVTRARAMFRSQPPLAEHFAELARIATTDYPKTSDGSRGSGRRGLEWLGAPCGAP